MADRTNRQYADLEDALRQRKIRLENRPTIRALVAAIGCSRFEETTKYIKATRIQPGKDLQIGQGWVEGFETSEEAEAALGVKPWHGTHGWGGWLPIHNEPSATSARPGQKTSGEFCACTLELTPSGECPEGHEQPQEARPVSLPSRPSES